jgi:hypothetical protein
MAITASTRSELITLVAGIFGAAPGASVLTELTAQYEAGASPYPTFMTTEEFSTQFVANLFAGTDSAAQAELVDIAVSLLNAGTTRGELIVLALNALAAIPTTDATYGASASALTNKVDVAIDYSVTLKLSGSSLKDLQNIIYSVTSESATKDSSFGS